MPDWAYYAAPMKIYVEEKYTRAAPGGIGFAKTAGNYAASLQATHKPNNLGYDQVLWTDAFEHRCAGDRYYEHFLCPWK